METFFKTNKLSEIKMLRKKVGITQKELAKLSGVSQSLIAKIEADSIDPAFSNISKIFSALRSLQKKESLTAKDLIRSRVFSCKPDDSVKDVIKSMKKHEISQLPVLESDIVLGIVSETGIIDRMLNSEKKDLTVFDVMEENPPIISSSTDIEVVSNLLKHFSIVIVQDKGKLKGIITRSDILRKLYY